MTLWSWLLTKTNIAYCQLELAWKRTILFGHHNDVGIILGIPHFGWKLVLKELKNKVEKVHNLKDIERMMWAVEDNEQLKQLFIIFSCVILLAPTSRLEVTTIMVCTPRSHKCSYWLGISCFRLPHSNYTGLKAKKRHVRGCLMFL